MKKRGAFSRIVALALILFIVTSSSVLAQSYIQYGDVDNVVGNLQSLLGISEHNDGVPFFGSRTRSAVADFQAENGLEETGEFDPNTLFLLLEIPVEDSSSDALVWIPMHGGSRYHGHSSCSNMIDPREVPVTCAEALGFSPCKRCSE